MPLSIHEGPEAIVQLRPAWEALEACGATHPFQTHAFARAWSGTVREVENARPLIVTLEENGRTSALFPANVIRYGPIKLLDWLAAPYLVDYGDILFDPASSMSAEQFTGAALDLLRAHERSAFLYLSNVRSDAIAATALGSTLRPFKRSIAPYLRLSGDFGQLLASLTPHNRQNLERHGRKLAAAGDMGFALITADDPRFCDALDRLLELQRVRYDPRNTGAHLFDARFNDFYRVFAREQGGTLIASLSLDGVVIAASLQCQYRGRMLVLVSAFDMAFSAYSPGIQLRGLLIRECFERGIDVVDMGWGGQAHKLHWTSDAEKLTTYVSNDARGWLLSTAATARRRLRGLSTASIAGRSARR